MSHAHKNIWCSWHMDLLVNDYSATVSVEGDDDDDDGDYDYAPAA